MVWNNPRAKRVLLGITCAFAPAAAWAQVAGGLLPALGTGYSSGDLRSSVESVLPGAPTVNLGARWQYTASVGVDVGLTQTSFGGAAQQSGTQFTTVISPSLNLAGDTRLLTVNLGYSPTLTIYAGGGPNQTYVSQNLNASATATVVPEALFVDVRALAFQTLRFGGAQIASNQFAASNDLVQTYSVGASVRYQHRFHEWGTLTASYNIDRTIQGDYGNRNSFGNLNGDLSGNGYGTTGNLTTQSESASFVTGENLQRWQYRVNVNANQYPGGSGVYGSSSYENDINNTLSYAASHGVAIFGSVGYQNINYGRGNGTLGYKLNDLTWAVGVRLTPNPDSNLSVQYGKSYGQNSIEFDGTYVVTPRIRVAARYTTGVTSGIQQLQSLTNTTRVGANGILLDSQTGLPVVPGTGFGSQYALSQVDVLNISAFYLLTRDTFSASVTNTRATSLVGSNSFNGVFVPANTSSSSTVGTLSWQHDLNPATSLNSSVSYGVINNGNLVGTGSNAQNNSQNTVAVSTSLNHTFSDTLSGHVLYAYSSYLSGSGSSNSYQNVFLAGLRKTF